MSSSASSEKTFYTILGISETATTEEIKKAYKKAALKCHPDRCPEDHEGATQKFKELSEAYEVLSDPDKRKRYDQFGKQGLNGPDGGDTNYARFDEMFKSMFSEGNPFGAFMGGMNDMGGLGSIFGTRGGDGHGQKKDGDIRIQMIVSLAACYNGSTMPIELPRKSYCSACDGYGSEDKQNHECAKCEGAGVVMQLSRTGPFMQQTQVVCPTCKGKKYTDDKFVTCNVCEGKKLVTDKFIGEFSVPRGAVNGDHLTIPGQASHIPRSKGGDGKRGDFVIYLKISDEDSLIKRDLSDPMNLVTELKITLSEALCGFSKTITHLDDREIPIVCGDVCTPDHILTVVGEEMKKSGQTGDLIIRLQIEYPTVIRSKRSLWKALEACEYVKFDTADNIIVKRDQDAEETEREGAYDAHASSRAAPECKTM